MKKIKATITLIIWTQVLFYMQSCMDTDNDNSFTPLENTLYNTALATVIIPSEKTGEAIIESDYEGHTYVVNPQILTQTGSNKEGQRIFYRYVKTQSPFGLSDNRGPYIRIIELQPILTKPIDVLTAENEDIYGNDVINYISYSMSKTYLTLQFQIYGSNSGIPHRISLVVREGTMPDDNGLLEVEFRHNAENDLSNTDKHLNYVSFPLNSVPGYNEGKLKGFRMTYQSMSNNKQTITISHNNNNSSYNAFAWENTFNTKIK